MTIEQTAMSMTVEDFLSYVKETKSKHTFKLYRNGIMKFAEWFEKTPNEILEMRKEDWISGDLHRKKGFARKLERYHNSLMKCGYSTNSSRSYCVGILQLFRYYEMPITIPTGSNVNRTVISTKDFVPTPQQYRDMYKVADNLRDKLIVSMGKDLGWRIGDFVKIRKDMLPILDQDAPIPFELITEKEDVLAKSFLSQETVDLLREYLPTIEDNPNPYLFPSTNGNNHIDTDTINNAIRQLAEKAKIKIPKNKRLRFHCFRKRFLSECANLSVDINTAKIMCGKNVENDMLTYLSEVEHRAAFLKVQQRLRLTETKMRKRRETTTELEQKVEDLERMIHGIIALGGKDLVEKAKRTLEIENKDLWFKFKDSSISELIKQLGEIRQRKQKEAYKKLIENNNNNNNH